MHALERILTSAIVFDHFVIPEADVDKVALSLGSPDTCNDARMHQVAARLEVHDVLVDSGLSPVREVGDAR